MSRMKCVEKKTVLWALLFIFFLPAHAQYVDRNKTTLYVGMALPRTNLSEYAEQGVNVGIRQVIPLRRFFSLMVSAEMFRNRFTPTLHAAEQQQGFTYTDMGEIYNVPVFAHLNFGLRMDRHSNFRLWTEGAMGVNFRFVTSERGTFDQTLASESGPLHYKGTFATDYDAPKITLATQWGIGFTLFRRYSIGYVRYNLGRSKLTGETKISDLQAVNDDGSMTPVGRTTLTDPVEFNMGKLRSRYHVVRFGLTF